MDVTKTRGVPSSPVTREDLHRVDCEGPGNVFASSFASAWARLHEGARPGWEKANLGTDDARHELRHSNAVTLWESELALPSRVLSC